jgi:ABC-type sugar transport system ATPase subunit
MARVRIEQLTVRFGDFTAVDDLSLEIENGELVVFLGPSGCGKTTTLRCIAGLQTCTAGRIWFDDEDVTARGSARRNVAMVFQFVSLYPHLRVAANISFPLRARGAPRAVIEERLDWAARIFELQPVLRRFPAGLPPGVKQKVALARAVVRRPTVLLLDEPLSAIDEAFREEMRWELGHLQKELGFTTVYVTHDQREAMSLADRVVLMRDGRIVQVGTPAEMFERPADAFAAFFIGSPSMNFIEVTRDPAGLRLGGNGVLLKLPEGARSAVGEIDARRLRLGIRPQHVALTSAPANDAAGTFAAPVLDRYAIGRERYFDFAVGDEVLLGMQVGPEAGEGAKVAFDLAHAHLFDAETGRRLPVRLADAS